MGLHTGVLQTKPLILAFILSLVPAAHAGQMKSRDGAIPGLVSLWHFNEGAGTLAADSHDRNNPGTLNGTATFARGLFSSCVRIGGAATSDRVNIPDSPNLQPATMSAGCWIKSQVPTFSGLAFALMAKRITGGISWALEQNVIVGGTQSIFFSLSVIGNRSILGVKILSDMKWHFVVCTYDLFRPKLYIDGKLDSVGADTAAINYTLPGDLVIGSYATDGAGGTVFPGLIDEAFVFNRAISSAEVALMYQEGLGAHPVD